MPRQFSPTSSFSAAPRHEYQKISEQKIHGGSDINTVAISPDAQLIAVGSASGHILIYNHSEVLVDIYHCGTQVCDIQWNPPYQSMAMLFAGMSDGRIVWIYDIGVRHLIQQDCILSKAS